MWRTAPGVLTSLSGICQHHSIPITLLSTATAAVDAGGTSIEHNSDCHARSAGDVGVSTLHTCVVSENFAAGVAHAVLPTTQSVTLIFNF